jgi:deoxyribodipyrimidine photo-lyase
MDYIGDYIRHFVPELKDIRGKAIHDPFSHLDKAAFKKLGYPEPIVVHKEARERALRRYKNPGDK